MTQTKKLIGNNRFTLYKNKLLGEGSFGKVSNNQRKKNADIIELLKDRREELTGQLNGTLRVKALD